MEAVLLSLNETRALALKAARGAGLEWGMAEEAAAVAEHLASCGFAGLELLLDWLDRRADEGSAACPIETGTAFCDLPPDAPLSLGLVAAPAILLPFLARLARTTGVMPGLTTPEGVWVGTGELLAAEAMDLVLQPAASPCPLPQPGVRAATPAATLARLDALALRTTVPPSAASRDNAGAGLLDND